MRTQLTVISAAERRPPFDKMAAGGLGTRQWRFSAAAVQRFVFNGDR